MNKLEICCSGGCGKTFTGEGSFEEIAAVNNLQKVGAVYYCVPCYTRASGKTLNDARKLGSPDQKIIEGMKSETEGMFQNKAEGKK